MPAGGYAVVYGDTDLPECDYVYGSDVNPASAQGDTYDVGFTLSNSSVVTVAVVMDGLTLDTITYNDSGWPSSSDGHSIARRRRP